ncbi:hypothetical protein [Paenibacillus sp. USDA918EY]|uniref:hypothetical protein n=1 Tax=Paenibacillus sp. USDA918EY TaxID=2689575 RepID=UPI001F39F3D0|nr:hypothetical protein [Paenibacillus sp. USDA918EY]
MENEAFFKKNVYRRTFIEDRPRLAEIFLEIQGSRRFEAFTLLYHKKNVYQRTPSDIIKKPCRRLTAAGLIAPN